jgi:hypothetical protein
MIEALGYFASSLTVISFLMKDVVKLRIVNLIACNLFIIYGCLILSIPVVIVNFVVAIIQIIFLSKWYLKLKTKNLSNPKSTN